MWHSECAFVSLAWDDSERSDPSTAQRSGTVIDRHHLWWVEIIVQKAWEISLFSSTQTDQVCVLHRLASAYNGRHRSAVSSVERYCRIFQSLDCFAILVLYWSSRPIFGRCFVINLFVWNHFVRSPNQNWSIVSTASPPNPVQPSTIKHPIVFVFDARSVEREDLVSFIFFFVERLGRIRQSCLSQVDESDRFSQWIPE